MGTVVKFAGEIGLQDGLGALGIAGLSVDRAAGHMRYHGVPASPGSLGIAERVFLGRGLRIPDVTAVAAEVAGLDGLCDVFFDDDGPAGGVD